MSTNKFVSNPKFHVTILTLHWHSWGRISSVCGGVIGALEEKLGEESAFHGCSCKLEGTGSIGLLAQGSLTEPMDWTLVFQNWQSRDHFWCTFCDESSKRHLWLPTNLQVTFIRLWLITLLKYTFHWSVDKSRGGQSNLIPKIEQLLLSEMDHSLDAQECLLRLNSY